MLEKFIAHKKNLIFFKSIISILLVLCLSWLGQYINKERKEYTAMVQNAEESLTKDAVELYSISNSQNKIFSAYNKYQELLKISSKKICLENTDLIRVLTSLGHKYKLAEPMTVVIEQVFFNNLQNVEIAEKESVVIKNYNVQLKFATHDIYSFLAIVQEAYSYMPENTVLISLKMVKQDVLEPDMIYKFAVNHVPDLVFAKINMRIRIMAIK